MKHLLILLTAIVALTIPGEIAAQGIITRPTTKKEQPSKPKPNPKPAKKKPPAKKAQVNLRQTCENLDLYTTRDGECYFFSVDEWKALPASDRNKFQKNGVVIKNNGHLFSLDLHELGGDMEWCEATVMFMASLPTLTQAEAIVDQYEAVNNAIIQFGGDIDPMRCFYWTIEEKNPDYAWAFEMVSGDLVDVGKTIQLKVRAISPIPCSSAM